MHFLLIPSNRLNPCVTLIGNFIFINLKNWWIRKKKLNIFICASISYSNWDCLKLKILNCSKMFKSQFSNPLGILIKKPKAKV